MEFTRNQIIVGVLGVIGLIVLFMIVISIFFNPVADGMGDIFGGLGKDAAALAGMFDNCSKNGFFSPSCGLGLSFIAGGIFYVLGGIAKAFIGRNNLLDSAVLKSGKTQGEIIKESIPTNEEMKKMKEAQKDKTGKEPTNEDTRRGASKVALEKLNKTTIDGIKNNNRSSPAAVANEVASFKEQTKVEREAIDEEAKGEGVSEEDLAHENEVAEHIVEE
jgi:hypothetical protein